jgi:L-histidine N-alpha-methyltransferase
MERHVPIRARGHAVHGPALRGALKARPIVSGGSLTVESMAIGGFEEALTRVGPAMVHVQHEKDASLDFAESVARGLAARPRRLESRFLYDARGSRLYEAITRLPEYYPTRMEAAILARSAPRIRAITGPVTLLELGSGSSEKTDHLFRAYLQVDGAVRYIPVDISVSALRQAGQQIAATRPAVQVVAVNGTYADALPLMQAASPVMVLFLGSSIGNMDDAEMLAFLSGVSTHLQPGDFFLLGVDLVKAAAVLEAAYDDSAGVTAAFTRNLFVRINRELGSDVDVTAVQHVARWSHRRQRIEIDARFTRPQTVRVRPLARRFQVHGGESIRTEISQKYRLDTLLPLLRSFGLVAEEVFTDERNWYGLVLMRRLDA